MATFIDPEMARAEAEGYHAKRAAADLERYGISCPRCPSKAYRGIRPAWSILVAIFLFPIGLLALCAGRNPTTCPACGFTWIA
jgi:rubrerythrin